MSELLRGQGSFIDLLINGDKKQGLALLNKVTTPQVQVITEIFHNFLTLPLEEVDRKEVNKRKSFINKIARPTKSLNKRKAIIQQHKRLVLTLLRYFRQQLNGLIP